MLVPLGEAIDSLHFIHQTSVSSYTGYPPGVAVLTDASPIDRAKRLAEMLDLVS